MRLRETILKEAYFLALVLVLFLAVIYVFAPFLGIVVGSFILVEFFYPLYKRIAVRIGPWPASILTTLITILTVVIPILVVLIFAAAEAITFGAKLQSLLTDSGIIDQSGMIDLSQFKSIFEALNIDASTININDLVLQVGGQAGQLIYGILSTIINNFANLLLKGFFMVFTMIYIFVDYEKIGKSVRKISPLPDDLDLLFAEKFRATTRAVLKGTFIIAILQATSVAIVMAFMQIEPLILWWVIMVLLSIIPVGSGLVWFPLGLILIASGRFAEGIFLIGYSAVIINVIDTTFRPKLIKEGTNLHPVLALFSALGGLGTFGLIGLIYGPLIAVFFISIMEIYRKRYQTSES